MDKYVDIIEANFGVKVQQLKMLDGYANQNFQVLAHDGRRFVFKVNIFDQELFDFCRKEAVLLSELSTIDFLELPIPQQSMNGDFVVLIGKEFYRLYTWLKGRFLAEGEQTNSLIKSFGEKLAQLDQKLKEAGKVYEVAARKIDFDLTHFIEMKPRLEVVADASERKFVLHFFNQFEAHVLPEYGNLRRQLIHNDANDYNVLVDDEGVKGLIDFGDMVYAPLIQEVAVSLTYILLDKEDPLAVAADFLKGFHSVEPLHEKELDQLYFLIGGRLALSLVNSAYEYQQQPENEYLLISRRPVFKLIKKWATYSHRFVSNHFRQALGFEKLDEEKPEDLLRQRKSLLGPSLSVSYKRPILMNGALFQYMFDHQGNTILDSYNNIPHVGHNHPKVVAAGQQQMNHLNTNTRYLYAHLTDYAELLLSRFPDKLSKVFFVNSGSAASDLAIRMAQVFTRKKKVMVLEHGYHGNTLLGIDISHYKFGGKGGKGQADYVLRSPIPDTFRGEFGKDDPLAGKKYAGQAIRLINENSPAAFIAEPIVGCAGQVPLAKGYLNDVYQAVRQKGGVCISDEVQTGFGRMGSTFWGYELYDVVPDMVVLGKPMGNSHPMGAVITTDAIADAFKNGMEFFSSFGGNPVSCAIGKAVLEVIGEEGLQQNALSTGDYFLDQLKVLQRDFEWIGDVRGHGLFIGVELVKDRDAKTYFPELASFLKNQMREQNVLISTDGPQDNILKMKPPLCFNCHNVDEVIDKLNKLLKSFDPFMHQKE